MSVRNRMVVVRGHPRQPVQDADTEAVNNPLASDQLSVSAEELEREQQALLEAAPVEQTYYETLAVFVQAKHAQVERIEDRLENLLARQQARVQQVQAQPPGRLALPSTRRDWHARLAREQTRLHSLHARLEVVYEFKEGMGLHTPKIEELATRKMRAAHPELAADWDAMREAMRRHQVHIRMQEQSQKRERLGHSYTLNLTRPL